MNKPTPWMKTHVLPTLHLFVNNIVQNARLNFLNCNKNILFTEKVYISE